MSMVSPTIGKDHTTEKVKNKTPPSPSPSNDNLGKEKVKVKKGMVIVTQNFRGGLKDEAGREEAVLQLRRQHIDVICGQESGLPKDIQLKRWDTGELFISGGDKDNKRSRAGNVFILSRRMAEAYLKGGSQFTKHCPRLLSIQIPVNKKTVHIVNPHFPDSDRKKVKELEAYKIRVYDVLQKVPRKHLLVWAGDFNASTGIATDDKDEVCGPHGNPHQNTAGRELKNMAGLFGLKDVITFHEQKTEGTWVHMRSKNWHQIDRVFMRSADMNLVKKCVNGLMITDSDHFSVRLNLSTTQTKKDTPTTRQLRGKQDYDSTFATFADEEKKKKILNEIVGIYKQRKEESEHDRLMKAVEMIVSKLPPKKKIVAGWADLNYEFLGEAISARNEACLKYAKTKTDCDKQLLTQTRHHLKKMKTKAKNLWLLAEVSDGNNSTLPGRQKHQQTSKAIWQLARKIRKGLDKWYSSDERNIRGLNGTVSLTAEENVDNFRLQFENLFINDVDRDRGDQHYKKMTRRKTDRKWLPPTRHELEKSLRKLKDVAPGLSGIPSVVWKSFLSNETLLQTLLSIMKKCWIDSEVPETWTKLFTAVLPKKGDMSLFKNYRGISMAEVLAKVYATILKTRLEALYEDIAPEYCCGFRRGRGRNDSVYTVKQILRTRKEWGKESFVVFWDAIKCFDRIPREYVWTSMEILICK